MRRRKNMDWGSEACKDAGGARHGEEAEREAKKKRGGAREAEGESRAWRNGETVEMRSTRDGGDPKREGRSEIEGREGRQTEGENGRGRGVKT